MAFSKGIPDQINIRFPSGVLQTASPFALQEEATISRGFTPTLLLLLCEPCPRLSSLRLCGGAEFLLGKFVAFEFSSVLLRWEKSLRLGLLRLKSLPLRLSPRRSLSLRGEDDDVFEALDRLENDCPLDLLA